MADDGSAGVQFAVQSAFHSDRKTNQTALSRLGRLAVHNRKPLPILAFSNSCNRLGRFKFAVFNTCSVPVRFRTVLGRSQRVSVL